MPALPAEVFETTDEIICPTQLQVSPSNQSQYYFTIEGNIGCGKSTFLQILKEKLPEAKWIEEPVSEWQNLGGKDINILEKYYKEPNRWGFTFQIYAIFTRVKALQEACEKFPDKIKISERSVLADKYVFAQLMKDLGYMDKAEYEVFKSMYSNFESLSKIDQMKIIYLRCTPERCYQRTKQRNRQEQDEIPLQYLQLIHNKHEKWFEEYDKDKVLVIDTTEDFKNDQAKIEEMLRIEKYDFLMKLQYLMQLNSKLKTLTDNLKKSLSYRSKIEEQITKIGTQLLQSKLNAANITQKISNLYIEENQIDNMLIRVKQEDVRNRYKMQKLELKINQLIKKVAIQSQILQKKNNYSEQLKKKVESLDSGDKTMDQIQIQIEQEKISILEIENKIEEQNKKIQQTHQELLKENKRVRTLEEQLNRKRKKNIKKKEYLGNLQKETESKIVGKENIDENINSEKCKLESLLLKKKNLEQRNGVKFKQISKILDLMQSLGYECEYAKKIINSEEEAIQRAKLQKTFLNKKKQLSVMDTNLEKLNSKTIAYSSIKSENKLFR